MERERVRNRIKKKRKKSDTESPNDCDMIQLKFIHEFTWLGETKQTQHTIASVNHKSNQVEMREKNPVRFI